MQVGYARIAATDPVERLAAQRGALIAAGVGKVFTEIILGRDRRAVLLDTAIPFLRPGDVLVATAAEVVASSPRRLLDLVDVIRRRGASLVLLSCGGPPLDTGSDASRGQLAAVVAMGTLVRQIIAEGRVPAIAAMKARGASPGRGPRVSRAQVQDMAAAGIRPRRIGQIIGCSRSTVYRAGYVQAPPPPKVRKRSTRIVYPDRDRFGKFLPPEPKPVLRYE
jgi:DNA invertase Pin-like site-specific DNA recombinase